MCVCVRGLSTPAVAQIARGASFLESSWNQIPTGFFNFGGFEQHKWEDPWGCSTTKHSINGPSWHKTNRIQSDCAYSMHVYVIRGADVWIDWRRCGSVHMFSHYKHAISKLFPDTMRTSSLAQHKSCFFKREFLIWHWKNESFLFLSWNFLRSLFDAHLNFHP